MHQCKFKTQYSVLKNVVAISLSIFLSVNAYASDCQRSVKYYSSQQHDKFLVDVLIELPKGFDNTGMIEISGFQCMSEVNEGQAFKMTMHKSASLPQFDIIYTDPDGLRFNNILQATVFPWSKSVKIDMQSTVLSDLLKNIPNYRFLDDKDKSQLIVMANNSIYLKKWAALRSERIVSQPLVYSYPLPKNEEDLLQLAIDEFNKNYSRMQQNQIDAVVRQPDEVLLSLFTLLKSDKVDNDSLSTYLFNEQVRRDVFVKDLLRSTVNEIKQVELIQSKPLDRLAYVNVIYNTTSDARFYEQKFLLKRLQSEWLLSAAYNRKVN
ncbi:hypothetical protein ACED29_03205 [Shewanella sp. 5S214]|uniref:hypothetical protein n=1 Tax=Shewanella sp. 5S214 TaxID=3229999 RepID=UPI00352EC702